MAGLAERTLAALGQMIGLDTHEVKKERLIEMQRLFADLAQQLELAYRDWIDKVPDLKGLNPTAPLEEIIRLAQAKQSDFSQFLGGYSPFSTAKKKVEQHYKDLVDRVEQEKSKLNDVLKENEMIEEYNRNQSLETDKANIQGRADAQKHNKRVSAAKAKAEGLAHQVDTLMNSSNIVASGDRWDNAVRNVMNDTEALIQEVHNFGKE